MTNSLTQGRDVVTRQSRSPLRDRWQAQGAPGNGAEARRQRWRRRQLVDALLALVGGLFGAAPMPVLLYAGHRGAYLLYFVTVVIAGSIAAVIIAPPRPRPPRL